jgi:CRP-like cAMP-binding protein
MCVANTAWILASNGLRVLAVDWDLEAPGLHQYFHPFLPDPELRTSSGVIDLIWEFAEAVLNTEDSDEPGWHEKFARISPYSVSIQYNFPDAGTIDFVPAGRQGSSYSALVSSFDWENFYDRLGGGGFLEALKRNMSELYDYVLIDSRTGLSDTAGICTVQFPDILVNCFSLSTQAIDGATAVAASVKSQEQNNQIRIFPVPMRVEDGEQDKLDASRDYARDHLGGFLSHLADPERYWGEVEVPYKSFYAYEEILATIGDRPQQENTVLAATERIVSYLTGGQVTALAAAPAEPERRALLTRFQRVRTSRPAPAASLGTGFWGLLSTNEQAALSTTGLMRSYSPGATIALEGDPSTHVFILLAGWVKILSTTRDDHEIVLAIRGDGDIVGELAGETTGRREATIQAIDTVQTLVVPYDRFGVFLDSYPGAMRAYRREITRRWNDTDTMLRRRAVTTGAQRLAGLLLDLATRDGTAAGDATDVPIPLSQEELASLAGTSRATVTRTFSNWRRRGIIRTGQQSITITDPQALRSIAYAKA